MKPAIFLLLCVAALEGRGQGAPGVQLGVGPDEFVNNVGVSASAMYFHPLLFKQIYATAGMTYSEGLVHYFPADPKPGGYGLSPSTSSYFTGSGGAFVGLQIGDYTFVMPSLSYNFYGNHASAGWGFAGGLLLHPSRVIGVGFSIDYARLRFDNSLDVFGPIERTSFTLLLRFKFPAAEVSESPATH